MRVYSHACECACVCMLSWCVRMRVCGKVIKAGVQDSKLLHILQHFSVSNRFVAKQNYIGESCRDWPSSSIRPVLYIPYYCIPWHPLLIMSLISGISDDMVSFDEIAVLFKYLSPKVCFLCPRHNNQAVISHEYNTLGHIYRRKLCPSRV